MITLPIEKSIYGLIQNTIKNVKLNDELEFRFGKKDKNGFSPTVTRTDFYKIKSFLDKDLTCIETNRTDIIIGHGLRSIEDENGKYFLKKTKHSILDIGCFYGYVLRLAHATESIIPPVLTNRCISVRNKQRFTYIVDNRYKYELTIIKDNNCSKEQSSYKENIYPKELDKINYEIEIEWIQQPEDIKKLFEPVIKIFSLLSY